MPHCHVLTSHALQGAPLKLSRGHDVVIAAYKKFLETHQNAVLLISWYNPFPETSAATEGPDSMLKSTLTHGQPSKMHGTSSTSGKMLLGKYEFNTWLKKNGVDLKHVRHISNSECDHGDEQTAAYLKKVNVALFPGTCCRMCTHRAHSSLIQMLAACRPRR